MSREKKTPVSSAVSGPTASGRRYLAKLMDHAFREGWKSPDDFVKHFPAPVIMAALSSAPELRVTLLAAATGIYEQILRRKTPALAAEDLRLALEEGTTSSQQLLAAFSSEDRVRYLEPHAIWDFLAEDRFWELDSDATDELRHGAFERMTFTLGQALQERLVTVRDILDGLTYEAVADSLAPDELRKVVRYALVKGRDGIGLSDKVLLEVLPLDKIVRSVPLDHVWHAVVLRRIAIPCGLTDLSREERRESQAARQPSGGERSWPAALASNGQAAGPAHHAQTALPPSTAHEIYPSALANGTEYEVTRYAEDEVLTAAPPSLSRADEASLPAPAPRSSLPPPLPFSAGDAVRGHSNATALAPLLTMPQPPLSGSLPHASAPAFEAQHGENVDRQRQRVTEHLRAIGRLPPNYERLPTPVLRSIDAMYALLPSATDDIQRKSVIRQAFANENYLRAALLGLIELMDSTVDTSDPVIQGAKIDALVKILLFEEQRRKETGRFAPNHVGSARSVPPSSLPPDTFGGSVPFIADAGPSAGYDASPYASPSSPTQSYLPSALPSHVATEPPPAPVLGGPPPYAPPAPPLPNLPADGAPARRRTVPPPLPPSFPRS